MKLVSRRMALLGLGAGLAGAAGCAPARRDDEAPGSDDPAAGADEDPTAEPSGAAGPRVLLREDVESVVVAADAGTVALSRALFEAADVVVVASAADAEATAAARRLSLPLLLASEDLGAELDRLGASTIVGFPADGTLDVGGREVISASATVDGLPLTPAPADCVALRVADEEIPPEFEANLAAAGVELVDVAYDDPRATGDSVAAVRAAAGVIGVGAFAHPDRFASRVEDARTLPELAGGGVAPFPGRMMVALYGHPSGPTLGCLGEQGPRESVARVQALAAEYQQFTDKPVVGCFEIIATVASAAAGPDGDYSNETPIDQLRPLIEAAAEHGVYCILDLQPGYTDFRTQAMRYEELLRLPHVGLALDPEWRLRPGQRHMTVIGQVQIAEVNETAHWLADLVAANSLPPKVLVLHQFQTRMIVDRHLLDTSRDEVQYLMHADGHGTHGQKFATWDALRVDLPDDVWLGWKNFIDEDSPMMTPEQTMEIAPRIDFVSYQ